MKLLLDTHIWLWSVTDPSRLATRVAKALEDTENELWLSSISVWELTVLHRKRRLKMPSDVPAWVATSVDHLRLTEAPLTVEVALAVPSISFSHADPADQLLAATAKVFDLTLVTADEHLLHLPGIRVLANR